MKSRRKPMHLFNETMVQAAIVEVLKLAGFSVKHTSAFRQTGPSGVSKGIPDLLVSHRGIPLCYFGMEVKLPSGKLSPEQQQAVSAREYVVVRSPVDALDQAIEIMGPQIPETDFLIALRVQRSLRPPSKN